MGVSAEGTRGLSVVWVGSTVTMSRVIACRVATAQPHVVDLFLAVAGRPSTTSTAGQLACGKPAKKFPEQATSAKWSSSMGLGKA